MASDVDRKKANSPIGGYVLAVAFGIFTLLAPYAAIKTALEGEVITGLLMLLLGIPMFGYFAFMCLELNYEVQAFRAWLREAHQWLYALGIVARLGFGVLLLVAFYLDVTVFNANIANEFVAILGILLMYSMFSVMMSGFALMLMSWVSGYERNSKRESLISSIKSVR